MLQSDIDRDGYISKQEADVLGKRLLISMEANGIVFDIRKFHHAVGLSPSICGVLAIVRHLLPDENDNLASFYSMDDIDSNPEQGGLGLEKVVWEEERWEEREEREEREEQEEEGTDDVYDMFYMPVEEDFHRGNAHAIHLSKEYCARNGELPRLVSISSARWNSLAGLRCSVSGGDNCEPSSVRTELQNP